jgi:N utilization substance protein A
MKSDLYTAIAQIAAERNIPREAVQTALEHALKTVYRRDRDQEENETYIEVDVDPTTGEFRVIEVKRVVEEIEDETRDVLLSEALVVDPDAYVGKEYRIDRTPENFGRIAAQTAKQVILQRIRDYERETVYEEFKDRAGEVMTGVIQRADHRAVIVELGGKAEAIMPAREQVPNERYSPGQRLKVYLKEVNSESRGPQLIVSRTHGALIKRLFELEVPEVFSGAVEIEAIAREPGLRSKVAVAARQENVDPVGSCVGIRGVRIQNIVDELQGEKIDVIEYASDIQTFIANALSPAKPISVQLIEDGEQKVARVVVPTDQMSLAIGKDGQNARLAYKLTGWRIDVKDPESLREGGDDDFLRQAQEALAEVRAEQDFFIQGRQPRLVRPDGTFIHMEKEFGPLPDDLVGMSVDVEVSNNIVHVHYNRDLRARFDFETGDELPLYDEVVLDPAR